MKSACLILLSSVSLLAQDGTALLRQSAAALESFSSYEMTQVTTSEPASMTMTMHVQSAKPGKHRMEMNMMGMAFTMLSDGKGAWMIAPAMKKYMKLPTDAESMKDFGAAGLGTAELEPTESKVIRSESIEVDGAPHDCWVVEGHGKTGASTYWIDKAQGFQLKRTIETSVAGQQIRSTITTQSIKLNASLPDSLFAFAPPADFKETDELFPGMNAMLKPAEHVPQAAVAAPPAFVAIEPQAFVPNLFPLHQAEPIGPGNGMVEILATIDPAGNVVNAEVLTGKAPLRQPAIDALRQWKFRPVIREGRPVYAATQVSIDFWDRTSRQRREDLMPDLHETMAAGERIAQLQSRFPRTQKQVLADLEQDLGGGDGLRRFSQLPMLAKAALDADDLDKATSYAKESLTAGNAGYDGIHDGNMVLGVVAVRQGNIDQAKQFLAASARTKGSPVLNSFGPNMTLAKALLEKGERDAVLDYFTACRAFWKSGAQQLDAWTATVRRGEVPDFGANLVY